MDCTSAQESVPLSVLSVAAPAVPLHAAVVTARGDLLPNGCYGQRWLLASADRIAVVSANGGMPVLDVDAPVRDVLRFELEPLPGGGSLQAVAMDGRTTSLLSYTHALAAQFGRVCAHLNALCRGEPIAGSCERVTSCPTCGLALGSEGLCCPRCRLPRTAVRRLLRYARPYRWRLLRTSILLLMISLLGLLPPYLMKRLIDDVLLKQGSVRALTALLLALTAAYVLRAVLGVWRGALTAWVGTRISFDVRSDLYEQIQWASLRYHDRHPSGALVSRVTQDTLGVQEVMIGGLPWIFASAVSAIGIAAVMMMTNWRLALVALAPAPLVLLVARLYWRALVRAFHGQQHHWGELHAVLNDALGRVKITKALSQQRAEITRYAAHNRGLREAALREEQVWHAIPPLIALLVGVSPLLVWYVGGSAVLHRSMTIGQLVMFVGYLTLLYTTGGELPAFGQWFSRAATTATRLFEVIDAETEGSGEHEYGELPDLTGEIEFRNVTFGYRPSQPVLSGVSFRVPAGSMLGLVGRSGAGKSTIVNLICRLYDPDQGQVRVDGMDARQLPLHAYRLRLGVVLQEPFLLQGSIADNIAYGSPISTFADIVMAAKAANAHDFILSRPDGYDEQVGERGERLSAGEKQRISIARAFLRDPAILILDEATANVDLETEEQIQQALKRLIQGRTTIAIAHRLSTLREAGSLLVIDEGRVVEHGTHKELRAKRGLYYNLLETHRRVSMVTAVDG
jgi:ATP-binding cassette subfamily B protein